jgi:hypothetical protein
MMTTTVRMWMVSDRLRCERRRLHPIMDMDDGITGATVNGVVLE